MTAAPIPAGVYDDLPEERYHADPALSASGAKQLLPPSCPALYRHERDHGRAPKRAWDIGHAAHQRVLGIGPELVVVEVIAKDGAVTAATDYRTKSAQEHRDEIRAAGAVPVLLAELEAVDAMADAIRQHPVASVLFDPDRGGRPEVSIFWCEYGVDRRSRLDWLPPLNPAGRLIVPDYKTTTCAARSAVTNSVASYGYAIQDQFYRDAVRAAALAEDVAFVFVFQEKTPPFLVNVVELDDMWQAIGRAQLDQALSVFEVCTATGVWPSYSDDVELISPPGWLARQYEDVTA